MHSEKEEVFVCDLNAIYFTAQDSHTGAHPLGEYRVFLCEMVEQC